MVKVYIRYRGCLERLDRTLIYKSNWQEFDPAEKQNVKTLILLARLLYEMCKTNLVVTAKGEDKVETVNEAVSELIFKANQAANGAMS